ncbi:cytosine permease [Kurthia populi]|uniref:Cytosine permease n=1 Tax=Kurthia populi TaxID=1562132 RepID=A0ABW5XVP2_9BACL
MSKTKSNVNSDIAFAYLPTATKDRKMTFFDLLLVQTVIGLSAFGLLTGAYAGNMLETKDSMVAVIFGNAFPMFLIAPVAIYFAKYGVDTFVGFRSALGYNGGVAFFVLFYLLSLGYSAVALFMAGEAMATASSLLSLPSSLTGTTGTSIFAIMLFFIALFIVFRGPGAIRIFNLVAVPAFFLFLIGLIVAIMFSDHIPALSKLSPVGAFENHQRSFMTALEINIALGFSWLPYLGQYSRLAKSTKAAYSASFYSYGVIVVVAAIAGALAALVSGSLYPGDWMNAVMGSKFAIVGLLLLTVANLGATLFLMYSFAISFKTMFSKSSWILAVSMMLPTVFLLLSSSFYDAFNIFMSVISFSMASLGGILIADYFFIKRQNISMRDLYNTKGAYRYWFGFNPSALVALLVAYFFYWGIYNPVTLEAHSLFLKISAGVPTFFLSCIVYIICAKFVFRFEVDRVAASNQTFKQYVIQHQSDEIHN